MLQAACFSFWHLGGIKCGELWMSLWICLFSVKEGYLLRSITAIPKVPMCWLFLFHFKHYFPSCETWSTLKIRKTQMFFFSFVSPCSLFLPEAHSKAREMPKSRESSKGPMAKEGVRPPQSFMHLNCHKLGSSWKRSCLHVCFFRVSLTVAPSSVVVFPKLFQLFLLM